MAGILDYLTGNDAAASPWGMLYQSPLLPNGAPQPATPDLAAAYGALGLDPTALRGQNLPAPDPFGDPSRYSVADPNAPAPQAPAPNPFVGGGATPFSFAGPGSMNVNPASIMAPQAPAAPQAAPVAPAPVAAPPAAAPPVAKPAAPAMAQGDDGEEETPASPAAASAAVRAGGAAAPAAAAPATAPFSLAGAGDAIGDRLMKATRGFMGNMAAGPIGALMGGAGALITGRETDPTAVAASKLNATAQALVGKGAPVADVQAAVNNPPLMAALIQQYYGKDKYKVVQTGETPAGKVFSLFNEADGTFKPMPGQAGGGAAAAGAGTAAFSLPESYDPKTRRDEAFIKALDPTTRQVVEAAYNGDNVPQGRNLQKYMPTIQRAIQGFDPSSYQARLAFNREMGSGKAGYGLQASGFQQSLEHLDTLAKTWLNKGNVNGLGFPDLAHFANGVREHWSNDQAGAAVSLENEAQQAAGEVGKLFSGAQGGGVHEREQTKGYLGNSRASGPEAAAGLESTLNLMMGGLSKLEQARDRAYDGNAPEKYNFLGPKQQEQIDRIRTAIQQLKSGASAPTAAAPGAAASGGTVNVGGNPISWKVN